ncbi:MAG: hypothetical protein PHW35_06395 [Lentimicrobiaceae bacterium]|jgi:hypothetical protein|nr:hypothetical protein [Lentimicrobiaceae bacterium]MDY0026609.1 hypothetical protein [Lentimicrobium sp.]
MKKIFFFLLIPALMLSAMAHAQDKTRIGLSGSIQGNQFGIMVPIWLGEKFVLAPAIDYSYAEKSGSDIGIGVASRLYLKKETLSPYVGVKAGVLLFRPYFFDESDQKTTVDLLGGVAFGGEYFLSEQFSFGVEIQGNLTKSDEKSYRYGNPGGVIFNLATQVSATIYF